MRPLPALAESRAAARRLRRIETRLRAGTRTLAGVCLEMGDQCGELGLLPASPRLAPIGPRLPHVRTGGRGLAYRPKLPCLGHGCKAKLQDGWSERAPASRPGDFRTRPLIGACQSFPNDDRDERLPLGNYEKQFRCGVPRMQSRTRTWLQGPLSLVSSCGAGCREPAVFEPHGRRTSFRG
jgi:hypothetical protein